jgi:hypothetical protein
MTKQPTIEPLGADELQAGRSYDAVVTTLARIIHIFEDNKSLLCYKHVD